MHVNFYWITWTWNAFLQVRWCSLGERILFHKLVLSWGTVGGLIFPPIVTFRLDYCHLDIDRQQWTSLGWSSVIKSKQRILLDCGLHRDSLSRYWPYVWNKRASSLPKWVTGSPKTNFPSLLALFKLCSSHFHDFAKYTCLFGYSLQSNWHDSMVHIFTV